MFTARNFQCVTDVHQTWFTHAFLCVQLLPSAVHTLNAKLAQLLLLLCVNTFSLCQLCSYHLIHLTTPSSCLKLPNAVTEKLFEKLLANKMSLGTTIGSMKIIIKTFYFAEKREFF